MSQTVSSRKSGVIHKCRKCGANHKTRAHDKITKSPDQFQLKRRISIRDRLRARWAKVWKHRLKDAPPLQELLQEEEDNLRTVQ